MKSPLRTCSSRFSVPVSKPAGSSSTATLEDSMSSPSVIFPSLMGMVPETRWNPRCFTLNPTVLRAASTVQVPVSAVVVGFGGRHGRSFKWLRQMVEAATIHGFGSP
jgi:hypothetical protein